MTKSEIRALVENREWIILSEDTVNALHRKMVEGRIEENEKYQSPIEGYKPEVPVGLKNCTFGQGMAKRQSDINFQVHNRIAELRRGLE